MFPLFPRVSNRTPSMRDRCLWKVIITAIWLTQASAKGGVAGHSPAVGVGAYFRSRK